jgi:hypothetical protein
VLYGRSNNHFFRALFFFGIFAPDFRASDRPMAIACFRLFTDLPERPLLSSPRFISCIARFTLRAEASSTKEPRGLSVVTLISRPRPHA